VKGTKNLFGYASDHESVYEECRRDAERGEIDSTLANMDALSLAELEGLLRVVEERLKRMAKCEE
jgi:hypothetical protein